MKLIKIIVIVSLFVLAGVFVSAGKYVFPNYWETVFIDTDVTAVVNDKLTINGTLDINGGLEIFNGNTTAALGNKLGIGTLEPTKEVHVIGDVNVTGIIHYGALQGNSPHKFLGDSDYNHTRMCFIATDNTVIVAQIEEKNDKYEMVYVPDTTGECDVDLIQQDGKNKTKKKWYE